MPDNIHAYFPIPRFIGRECGSVANPTAFVCRRILSESGTTSSRDPNAISGDANHSIRQKEVCIVGLDNLWDARNFRSQIALQPGPPCDRFLVPELEISLARLGL